MSATGPSKPTLHDPCTSPPFTGRTIHRSPSFSCTFISSFIVRASCCFMGQQSQVSTTGHFNWACVATAAWPRRSSGERGRAPGRADGGRDDSGGDGGGGGGSIGDGGSDGEGGPRPARSPPSQAALQTSPARGGASRPDQPSPYPLRFLPEPRPSTRRLASNRSAARGAPPLPEPPPPTARTGWACRRRRTGSSSPRRHRRCRCRRGGRPGALSPRRP